jgi:hypothetical protein
MQGTSNTTEKSHEGRNSGLVTNCKFDYYKILVIPQESGTFMGFLEVCFSVSLQNWRSHFMTLPSGWVMF